MSKELFIIFVYDTQLCQKEEDDPQDAVLYFYPQWVTEQQRLALCGQLMGATQFSISLFSCPRIISLNSGKFAILNYNRYIIAVGTDRNIPDWVIQHRADILHHLLQLYHKDLPTISKNANLIGIPFREKLSQIFETFLPILQYAVDIFCTIPTIRLPKSASNVFLEAIQILHCSQEKKGVLGGMVLYQNRVVATQLCANLTKSLVSTDPYRIKSQSESVSTTFHLPVGVQLLKVYIKHKEFSKLFNEAKSARISFESLAKRKQMQKRVPVPIGKTANPGKDHTGMKRDISRIFTVHEEEGESEQIVTPPKNGLATDDSPVTCQKKQDQFTSSSQCTTPMKDVNMSRVLHERVLSICRISESDDNYVPDAKSSQIEIDVIPDVVKDAMKTKMTDISLEKKDAKFLLNYSDAKLLKSQSTIDIRQRTQLSSSTIPLRAYSFGLPKLSQGLIDEEPDKHSVSTSPTSKHYYNTITDPLHPLFRCDGRPISRSLFDKQLADHYKLLEKEKDVSALGTVESNIELLEIKSVPKPSPAEPDSHKDNSSKTLLKARTKTPMSLQLDEKPRRDTPSKQELYRRSLSLPLKNLTTETTPSTEETRRKSTTFPAGPLESPSVRTRMIGSLPLTPLMAKLSSLAFEENSGGFNSRDTTPSEFRDFGQDIKNPSMKIKTRVENNASTVQTESEKKADKAQERVSLYIFGQQSMALILLLEEEPSLDPELIHSLWETSVGSLNKLEGHLRQCLEQGAQNTEPDSYSYICMDPDWDMVKRGGPWGCLELETVGSLHNAFREENGLTEIAVRCEDSTIYGYQCGKTEVYYQQSSTSNIGLPVPSDLMGVAPLKARRRLERDHGIVLL